MRKVSISDTTPEFKYGIAEFNVTLTDTTEWAAEDDIILTISSGSEIGGYDLVNATGITIATLTT